MKKFSFMALLGVLILILAACTDDSNVEEEATEGEETAAAEGGTLTLAIPSDAVSMDPHGSNDVPSEQIRDTIYEPLLTQDENFEIVPVLAEEYEQVDDTTWQFKLREGVTFHDGSEFNADVVKANIERVKDPAKASPRSFLLEMVSEVNVIDDYTVELVTEYPFAPLANNLTHGAGKMISKDLIDADYQQALDEAGSDLSLEEYYDLRAEGGEEHEAAANEISSFVGQLVESEPVGTNYFKFDSRSPGEQTAVVRNDDYWGDTALLDGVTFKVVSEPGSRIAELESGSSDAILATLSSNIDRVENNEDVTLLRNDSVSIDYIGFNTEKEPFDDPRVRQAITHAFDSQAVLDGVYNGSGTPAEAPLAPGVLGYSEDLEGLEYDMDRAEELLDEAGVEDLTINLMVNDDNPERVDVALWLQESLSNLGITVNVEQVEWGAYLAATGAGEHDMFILGWSNSTGDPDNGITPLFHSDNIGDTGNRSFYNNPELDSILDEARQSTEESEREELYMEAQQILVDEAPAIFIRHGENLNAYGNHVEGFGGDAYNIFDFRGTSIQ
ncbi:glutathione ABC transporter substrate-binding protein [Jeotgalicoccus halotolerans]|uniref:Peptide/nickel transport system substrate-binding protein n=1 Tax=Jeotgalicoccus halotolerans TaxID=157227 RepID=A0A3E0AVZ8_9STAP|nr:glutathione ABC transporter substrate-binding protein [Jeotgalicoccus halotolerans]REG22732.1 peptide/nickel transport system substrate-binding protein [Jeotgalicoccus halotolerans]